MKKTFITLAALSMASLAGAIDLTDADITVSPSTETTAFTSTDNTCTVVVTLDVNALKKVVEAGATPTKNPILRLIGDNGSDTYESKGVGTNYSSDGSVITNSGFWGYAKLGDSGEAQACGFGNSIGKAFDSSTDWDSIDGASLVLVQNSLESFDLYFTTADNSVPSTTTVNGTCTSMKWSGTTTFNVSELQLNTDLVKAAYIYNDALSADDAKTVGVLATPEPATATLSLLALAGLAARRRRH